MRIATIVLTSCGLRFARFINCPVLLFVISKSPLKRHTYLEAQFADRGHGVRYTEELIDSVCY